MKTYKNISALFFAFLLSGTLSAQFTGSGNGDSNAPYEIENEAQFREINSYPLSHFILMNDIDMSGSTSLTISSTFSGELNGNGYSIKNFKTDKGVFTRIDEGVIKNTWFENFIATPGGEGAGALATYINKGTIKNCAFTGSVNGSANNMGGVVGLTGSNNGINISDCYVDIHVKGNKTVASIIAAAIHPVNIERCFITGGINATDQSVGAAVGLHRNGTANPSNYKSIVTANMELEYSGSGDWNNFNRIAGLIDGNATTAIFENNLAGESIVFINTDGKVIDSGVSTKDGLTISDEELKKQITYENIGYIFGNNESSPWKIEEDNDYPKLWFMSNSETPNPPVDEFTGEGEGSESSPYQITSIEELKQVNKFRNAYFLLMNDIDLSLEEDWTRIGGITTPFTGIFDGNGYIVSNAIISSAAWTGFFGTVDGGTIKNLFLKDIFVTVTGENGGGLIGYILNGTIKNCAVTGVLSGGVNNNMGGLIGLISGGEKVSISDCYVDMEVCGNKTIGSIIGAALAPVSVERCIVQGKIISPDRAAAAVGITRDASCSYKSIVALNLDIEYPGSGAMTDFNRIVGTVSTPADYDNNLAGESVRFINVDGKVIDSALDSKDGLTKTDDDLKLQATYEEIGYVFGNNENSPWKISSENGYPELWFMTKKGGEVTKNKNILFENEIIVYPNPVADYLQILSNNICQIEVYTPAGILVGQYFNTTTINVSAYSNGMYYLRVITPEATKTLPFIKK